MSAPHLDADWAPTGPGRIAHRFARTIISYTRTMMPTVASVVERIIIDEAGHAQSLGMLPGEVSRTFAPGDFGVGDGAVERTIVMRNPNTGAPTGEPPITLSYAMRVIYSALRAMLTWQAEDEAAAAAAAAAAAPESEAP